MDENTAEPSQNYQFDIKQKQFQALHFYTSLSIIL